MLMLKELLWYKAKKSYRRARLTASMSVKSVFDTIAMEFERSQYVRQRYAKNYACGAAHWKECRLRFSRVAGVMKRYKEKAIKSHPPSEGDFSGVRRKLSLKDRSMLRLKQKHYRIARRFRKALKGRRKYEDPRYVSLVDTNFRPDQSSCGRKGEQNPMLAEYLARLPDSNFSKTGFINYYPPPRSIKGNFGSVRSWMSGVGTPNPYGGNQAQQDFESIKRGRQSSDLHSPQLMAWDKYFESNFEPVLWRNRCLPQKFKDSLINYRQEIEESKTARGDKHRIIYSEHDITNLIHHSAEWDREGYRDSSWFKPKGGEVINEYTDQHESPTPFERRHITHASEIRPIRSQRWKEIYKMKYQFMVELTKSRGKRAQLKESKPMEQTTNEKKRFWQKYLQVFNSHNPELYSGIDEEREDDTFRLLDLSPETDEDIFLNWPHSMKRHSVCTETLSEYIDYYPPNNPERMPKAVTFSSTVSRGQFTRGCSILEDCQLQACCGASVPIIKRATTFKHVHRDELETSSKQNSVLRIQVWTSKKLIYQNIFEKIREKKLVDAMKASSMNLPKKRGGTLLAKYFVLSRPTSSRKVVGDVPPKTAKKHEMPICLNWLTNFNDAQSQDEVPDSTHLKFAQKHASMPKKLRGPPPYGLKRCASNKRFKIMKCKSFEVRRLSKPRISTSKVMKSMNNKKTRRTEGPCSRRRVRRIMKQGLGSCQCPAHQASPVLGLEKLPGNTATESPKTIEVNSSKQLALKRGFIPLNPNTLGDVKRVLHRCKVEKLSGLTLGEGSSPIFLPENPSTLSEAWIKLHQQTKNGEISPSFKVISRAATARLGDRDPPESNWMRRALKSEGGIFSFVSNHQQNDQRPKTSLLLGQKDVEEQGLIRRASSSNLSKLHKLLKKSFKDISHGTWMMDNEDCWNPETETEVLAPISSTKRKYLFFGEYPVSDCNQSKAQELKLESRRELVSLQHKSHSNFNERTSFETQGTDHSSCNISRAQLSPKEINAFSWKKRYGESNPQQVQHRGKRFIDSNMTQEASKAISEIVIDTRTQISSFRKELEGLKLAIKNQTSTSKKWARSRTLARKIDRLTEKANSKMSLFTSKGAISAQHTKEIFYHVDLLRIGRERLEMKQTALTLLETNLIACSSKCKRRKSNCHLLTSPRPWSKDETEFPDQPASAQSTELPKDLEEEELDKSFNSAYCNLSYPFDPSSKMKRLSPSCLLTNSEKASKHADLESNSNSGVDNHEMLAILPREYAYELDQDLSWARFYGFSPLPRRYMSNNPGGPCQDIVMFGRVFRSYTHQEVKALSIYFGFAPYPKLPRSNFSLHKWSTIETGVPTNRKRSYANPLRRHKADTELKPINSIICDPIRVQEAVRCLFDRSIRHAAHKSEFDEECELRLHELRQQRDLRKSHLMRRVTERKSSRWSIVKTMPLAKIEAFYVKAIPGWKDIPPESRLEKILNSYVPEGARRVKFIFSSSPGLIDYG